VVGSLVRTTSDLKQIQRIVKSSDRPNRAEISRRICRSLAWFRVDGRLKPMSCRVALLHMYRDGLIHLPVPTRTNGNGRIKLSKSPRSDPGKIINGHIRDLPDIHLQLVKDRHQSGLWNELIERYHYLGFKPLPGAQIRYLAKSHNRIIAALGFGAAAWKAAPRDQWIGWNSHHRQKHLHLIVNNARYLILPWVQVNNLASKTLAIAAGETP